MTGEHDALRARLGRLGAWTFAFDARPMTQVRLDAAELEAMGYSALWVPEGLGSRDVLAHLALLLEATDDLAVASGIANVTARQPEVLRDGALTLADADQGRLVLGIGIGHEYTTELRGIEWSRPIGRMRAYLDRMDEPSDLPAPAQPPPRLLAALGDGMVRLATERALGVHTYFVPVAHTEHIRSVIGPEPVIAVELTAVVEADPDRARQVAHGWARHYLELPNYARNLERMGFTTDELRGKVALE